MKLEAKSLGSREAKNRAKPPKFSPTPKKSNTYRPHPRPRRINLEPQPAQNVVEKNRNLHAVAAAAAAARYQFPVQVLRVEADAVVGRVVQGEVFVGDGGEVVGVEGGEEGEVRGGGGEADVREVVGYLGRGVCGGGHVFGGFGLGRKARGGERVF